MANPQKAEPDKPTANSQSPPSEQHEPDSKRAARNSKHCRIKVAGLPVVDPRTNTSFCAESGCVQLVTTDYFSVYQFADQAKADKFAAAWPLHYQNGLVFLRYTGDGSDPTDPALIPQYNAVLDQVMAG